MIQSLDASASLLLLSHTSSDNRFRDMNPVPLPTDMAVCSLRRNIQSGLLFRSYKKWQRIEMPHYFSLFMALTIYSPVCLFYIWNCSWKYKPSGICERGFSRTVKFWEDRHRSAPASNYLYLFVWANLCILFILYFKPSFSNGAETELKCNTSITENIPLAFYHTLTVGA